MKGHILSTGAKLEEPVTRDEFLEWKAELEAEDKPKRMTNE